MTHAGYDPLFGSLDPAEKAFLARLAPAGIDWRKTRAELRPSYARRYRDTWDAVVLPASKVLSDDPLELWAQCFPETLDLPPEYWFAEYFPYDDARQNHDAIELQIAARLGPPARNDVSNCLVRVWRIGVFRVELHTFPPDMQSSFKTTNVLHQKEPRLAIASSISIHSDYALVFPDASLSPIASRLGTPAVLELDPSYLRDRRFLRRETRRNPEGFAPRNPIAWHDPDRIGISSKATSVVVERRQSDAGETRLVLERVVAGRGPSRSTLGIGQATTFLHGDDETSLDAIAKQLATFWSMPMEIQTVQSD